MWTFWESKNGWYPFWDCCSSMEAYKRQPLSSCTPGMMFNRFLPGLYSATILCYFFQSDKWGFLFSSWFKTAVQVSITLKYAGPFYTLRSMSQTSCCPFYLKMIAWLIFWRFVLSFFLWFCYTLVWVIVIAIIAWRSGSIGEGSVNYLSNRSWS